MSRGDIEVVRGVFEAFKERDVESILALWHADAEWRPSISPGGIERTTYVGHEGLRRWLADLAESWEVFEVTDMSFELVGHRVLALGQVRVRGAASGVEIEGPLSQVWEIEGGKARRGTAFMTHAEARQAVGLRN